MPGRCLMIWLIISIAGYGSVWAFDSHLDETAEHHGVVSDVGLATDGEGDSLSCDHCCHASAHTLALSPFLLNMTETGTCTGFTPYRNTLSNLPVAPLEHPPQS